MNYQQLLDDLSDRARHVVIDKWPPDRSRSEQEFASLLSDLLIAGSSRRAVNIEAQFGLLRRH